MDNNQRFLNSFNNIEDHLKVEANDANNSSFHYLLSHASKNNKVIAHYSSELNTLRQLRNFIVHGNIQQPLAIASVATVKRIKEIEAAIISPKKIREVFSDKIVAVKEDQSIAEVLKIIKARKYSQFPVICDNEFSGLITANGITNWLANNIKQDIISLKETCVKDVMIHDEEIDSYTFLYNYSTLYDVIKAFEKRSHAKTSSFVIIVLKRKTDKVMLDDIYTILTPWDLNKVYQELTIKN